MIIEKRTVGFKTILDLAKQRPLYLILALVLTVTPVGIASMFMIILTVTDPGDSKVDYELINKKGTLLKAVITGIEVQRNISINNEHPRVITYSFKENDQERQDTFRALDSLRISALSVGDTIQVKYLEGHTIIAGIKYFALPTRLLAFLLMPFVVVGLLCWGILFWRIRNQSALYKYGKIVDAEIISMSSIDGLSFSGMGKKIVVHYQYQLTNGRRHIGESTSTDYTLLTGKTQGDKIKIFVSPTQEEKSCIIPRLDAIRNNWKID
jgi:hypothetical protein